MNDLRHADELIEKYLDDLLSPQELEALECLLVNDPDAARLFNQKARTDQLIQTHFIKSAADVSFALDETVKSTPASRGLSGFADHITPSPWSWRTLRDHLWGPAGTVLLHIVLLLALIRIVSYTPLQKAPEYEVLLMQQQNTELDPLKDMPEWDPPSDLPETTLPTDLPVEAVAPPEVDAQDFAEAPTDFGAFDVINDVQSVLIMEKLAPGRTDKARQDALGVHSGGMGRHTEAAVLRALEWLKANQAPDGSWGPNKPAMTGLALLTFLAHGETTGSGNYGDTVEKAIRYIISQQDDSGRFCTINQPGSYAHAIAAYAIAEAYGMTRISSLKPIMEKSAQVVIDGQQPGGGWDYDYKKVARRDTSVAGWQMQALKAALIAGAENRGLREAIEKSATDLKSVQDPETGRFYYTDKSSHKSDSITAVAVLSLQLAGHATTREARAGLDALGAARCDWDKPPEWPMYAWYYITQARFHEGGPGWTRWNNQFARAFVQNQNKDGSWTSPGEKSGSAQGKELHLGPVYSTTLAALTLQVYYRHLPTYKSLAVEPTPAQSAQDLKVEVL